MSFTSFGVEPADAPPAECCRAGAPALSFTRPEGEPWQCGTCGRRWVYVVEESCGSMWLPAADDAGEATPTTEDP